jgi:hypothetical protein
VSQASFYFGKHREYSRGRTDLSARFPVSSYNLPIQIAYRLPLHRHRLPATVAQQVPSLDQERRDS